MDAARENARLGRCAIAARLHDPAQVDVAAEHLEQPLAGFVGGGDADRRRPAAEGGDIFRGVPRAARDDLGRVVIEDQHRRFARDARDLAVDELVGQQIAEHRDPDSRKIVDESKQALVGCRWLSHPLLHGGRGQREWSCSASDRLAPKGAVLRRCRPHVPLAPNRALHFTR
jgi:hypothetical protein